MRRPTQPIAGRVVAVTGGARGIGAATAADLRSRGAVVATGDLDPTGDALSLDVTDRGSFTAFLDAVEERHGAIDVLVNNAGVMHVGPFLEEPDDWSRRQVEVNLRGRPQHRGHLGGRARRLRGADRAADARVGDGGGRRRVPSRAVRPPGGLAEAG